MLPDDRISQLLARHENITIPTSQIVEAILTVKSELVVSRSDVRALAMIIEHLKTFWMVLVARAQPGANIRDIFPIDQLALQRIRKFTHKITHEEKLDIYYQMIDAAITTIFVDDSWKVETLEMPVVAAAATEATTETAIAITAEPDEPQPASTEG